MSLQQHQQQRREQSEAFLIILNDRIDVYDKFLALMPEPYVRIEAMINMFRRFRDALIRSLREYDHLQAAQEQQLGVFAGGHFMGDPAHDDDNFDFSDDEDDDEDWYEHAFQTGNEDEDEQEVEHEHDHEEQDHPEWDEGQEDMLVGQGDRLSKVEYSCSFARGNKCEDKWYRRQVHFHFLQGYRGSANMDDDGNQNEDDGQVTKVWGFANKINQLRCSFE